MSDILKDAAHWKERADDARRLANEMTDEKTRRNMLEIAESYERLAVRAQLRTNKN
jgi:hypothetical protein